MEYAINAGALKYNFLTVVYHYSKEEMHNDCFFKKNVL